MRRGKTENFILRYFHTVPNSFYNITSLQIKAFLSRARSFANAPIIQIVKKLLIGTCNL